MFDRFELDPRLAADTFVVDETPLSRVLLMNDARYPWLILVPRRSDITEPFELSEADQAQLWQ
ncbi:MAG: HIT domain-containing protein, partial [Halieaceae bacterium]